MSTAKRIKATRFVRIVRTSVALAARLAAVAPAHAASPDSVDMARVEQQLQEAQYARIGINGHSLVLRKPRVTSGGLAYESIDGFPTPRPAIIVGADWDSIPVRPNPIPWDDIDKIEAGSQDRTWGVILGGAAGLLGGFYLGAWSVDSRSEKSQMLVGPAICAAGAGLGALLLPITYWKQVYP